MYFNNCVVNFLESAKLHLEGSNTKVNISLQALLNFYGKETQTAFGGKTYISPPLTHSEEVLSEMRVFKKYLLNGGKHL